jgi:hypothetical protein
MAVGATNNPRARRTPEHRAVKADLVGRYRARSGPTDATLQAVYVPLPSHAASQIRSWEAGSAPGVEGEPGARDSGSAEPVGPSDGP